MTYRALVPLQSDKDPPRSADLVAALSELSLTDTNGQTQPSTMAGEDSGDQLLGHLVPALPRGDAWIFPLTGEISRQRRSISAGISTDDADQIMDFQKSTPVSYPLLIGNMAVMTSSAALGNTRQGLPFTAVFDGAGS